MLVTASTRYSLVVTPQSLALSCQSGDKVSCHVSVQLEMTLCSVSCTVNPPTNLTDVVSVVKTRHHLCAWPFRVFGLK